MKIVIPDYIDLEGEAKSRLSSLGAVLYDDVPNEGRLIDRVKEAEIITANYVPYA